MADNSLSAETLTSTITLERQEPANRTEPTVHLKLRKPKSSREVHWKDGTVDNEGMNKKKSKCCCIYEKPKTLEESSSESEEDCEHCRGHVEKKKKKVKHSEPDETDNGVSVDEKPDVPLAPVL